MKAKLSVIVLIVTVLALYSLLGVATLPSAASNSSSKNFAELV